MLNSILLSFLLSFNFANTKNPCEIFGSVCIVSSQYNADFIVYVETENDLVDLAVFKETSKLFADDEGIWFFTDAENFANYRIFITQDRRMADFTIQYVDERAFAGCP